MPVWPLIAIILMWSFAIMVFIRGRRNRRHHERECRRSYSCTGRIWDRAEGVVWNVGIGMGTLCVRQDGKIEFYSGKLLVFHEVVRVEVRTTVFGRWLLVDAKDAHGLGAHARLKVRDIEGVVEHFRLLYPNATILI